MGRYIYQDTIQDQHGNAVVSATVSVYLAGSSTAADIYEAISGGTAVNSVETDTAGKFLFFIDDSDYASTQRFKIVMSKSGYTTKTWDYIEIIPESSTDIKSFGAVGDGVTDDTTALQAAIDNASSGYTIYVPAGSYKITSSLTISGKSKLKIYGDGRQSKILSSGTAFDMLVIDNTCSDIEIGGIEFYGSAVGTEGKDAITVNAPRTTISGCHFENTNNGVFIHDEDAHDCQILNNRFVSLVGNVSDNGYGVYTISQRNIISGNQFNSVPRHDIYLSGSSATKGAFYNVVADNVSISSIHEAITVYAIGTQSAVIGNVIKGNIIVNPVIGIGIAQNAIANIVVGNLIIGASDASIYCNGSTTDSTYPDDNEINGNLILNSTCDTGVIRIINGSYNNIVGNKIAHSAADYGIFVDSTGTPTVYPTGNKIIGNHVRGSAVKDIYVSVTCLDTDINGNYGSLTKNGTLQRNWGTSSAIATGGTIAHGLSGSPTNVSVTAAESGPTDIYVSVDATNITVNFGGGGNKTFFWFAEIQP